MVLFSIEIHVDQKPLQAWRGTNPIIPSVPIKAERSIFVTLIFENIIQILTGTVMKYHVSVDCQESYIFPRDYIFPKCAALREILSRGKI